MYVRGEDLEKWMGNSLEARISLVETAVTAKVGVAVELLATREDGALFRTPDGKLHEATFVTCVGDHGPTVADVAVQPSTIPVHEEAALPRLVSDELRSITADLMDGKAIERTRVRSLANLVKTEEVYHVGQVIAKLDEACAVTGDEHWYKLYEANQEKIRTAMYGQIRELEAHVPKTAYARLPKTRLTEFEPELRESMGLLAKVMEEIIDVIRPLVFDRDDEFFGAIRESLIAEAQTLHGLLAKAGELMRAEDLERVAVAHDGLCGRARTMEVVSAYITGRAKKGAEESK
jgi:hypothetical protein